MSLEKFYKSYDYVSRYTPFYYSFNTYDNKYYYSLSAYLKDNTAYSLHYAEQGDTYDTLALKYYNNPTLYWVICSFNHITDPFKIPEKGTPIKIPMLSNIEFDFAGRY